MSCSLQMPACAQVALPSPPSALPRSSGLLTEEDLGAYKAGYETFIAVYNLISLTNHPKRECQERVWLQQYPSSKRLRGGLGGRCDMM